MKLESKHHSGPLNHPHASANLRHQCGVNKEMSLCFCLAIVMELRFSIHHLHWVQGRHAAPCEGYVA
ncbi:hypothetical protein Pla100_50270 [Neorhodopirellula pilleata]|uniref:Uncharacterized protein n=1 Tax=Neorhodopirellula pilleata TaxID=2714738 RepID=A0A5C5ZWY4_9BACT|nr:hypothetical protein Pla100_50270 [Neorhodopirellula pilleata]